MSKNVAESRTAIRAAMHQADIVRTSTTERIDPYEREARSLIIVGHCIELVTELIISRMALKITRTTATARVFAIEHSTKYTTLTVYAQENKVSGYTLV